ncbi:MAG: DUF3987 domain-containing protein [Phycisphaerae bacterium]|nr:DUF3987 domain-containing protein [Phycisphaerae bacterium]
MPPEARQLLGLIFKPDDLIEFRIIDPDGTVDRSWTTLAKPSPAAVANMIGGNSVKRAGIYFSVCARKHKGGKKQDVARARSLWGDFDGMTPDEVAYRCNELGIPPTIIISSGGGTHLYWVLDEPIEFDSPEAIAKVENANKRIAQAIGGDHVCDVSRVLRLPGFLNAKYDPARPCTIVKLDGPRWDFDRLLEFLPELPAAPTPSADGNGKHRGPVNHALVGRAMEMLAADPGDGDRSRRDHGALCTLYRAGCTQEHAQALCSGFSKFGDGRKDYFARSWVAAIAATKNETPRGDPASKGFVTVASAESLKIDIPAWRPCPVEALPPRLLEIVTAISSATSTDPAYATLGVLTAAAGCIGNRVAVLLKGGWVEPSILWGGIVGRSGVTKSPVVKAVTRPLVQLYQQDRQAFAEAMTEHAIAEERYGIELAAWKAAQKKGPPTDPPVRPEKPKQRRVLIGDITIEAVGAKHSENPLGLIAVREELASWVGSFDRYASGGKGSDSGAWLSMYDATPLVIDRKGGDSIFIPRAAVSIFGSIQPGILRRYFGAKERESGLLARLLLTYPPERAPVWTEAELAEGVESRWGSLLGMLLGLLPGIDDDGNPRPRYLPLGDSAKALWIPWHNAHAQETVEISNDDLGAHLAKLRGVCARLALIFACVRAADHNAPVNSIGPEDMQRAITFTDWLKCEAGRVYALLNETDAQREYRQLLEWITRRGGSCSVRDLTRGPRQYRDDPEHAQAALERLAEAGFGTLGYDSGPGRPSLKFRITSSGDGDETPCDAITNEGFDFETVDIEADPTCGTSAVEYPDVLPEECTGSDPPADYRYGT